MKEESLLLLSDLQKLINQVVLIDYTIIILGGTVFMKNKFIMTAAIVTAMTMVTPSLASAAEIQPIASET